MKKFTFLSCVLAATLFAASHGENSVNNHANHGQNAENPAKSFDPKAGEHLVIKMKLLGKNGDKTVGEIIAAPTPYGVAFFPELSGLPAGVHGFHVHENADCGATEKGLGMKAGGHWDPAGTKKHSFAWDDEGHKGDLPALIVSENGVANYPVVSYKIKDLSELKGHSLMIHAGGDNHSDSPKPLGGGGARLVCGVIK